MDNIEAISADLSYRNMRDVRHRGVVDEVGEQYVKVRIVQTSACASCKIANHCTASEMKVKTIDVYGVENASDYVKGQEVVVCASMDVARRALLFGFGIPLVLLVAVVALMLCFTGNEGWSALTGLLSLIPYYIILYVFRSKLQKKLRFWIENK